MNTLALSDTWDLVVKSGNLVVSTGPTAIAQDVASAVRLFKGELWYDTVSGVPYFKDILGQVPSGVVSARLVAAGLTVPNVIRIRVSLDPIGNNRQLTGMLTITDDRAQTTTIALS